MEAKEFLKQYQSILVDIRNMEATVEELESLAMKTTGNVQTVKVACGNKIDDVIMERVQTSGSGDSMANLVVKICDIEAELKQSRAVALEKLKDIRDVIQQVENKDYRQLLHRRYIEGDKWEKIAFEMDFNYRWVLRLHGRALKKVAEIINRP